MNNISGKPERTTKTHIYFWGSCFSNWAECRFKYKSLDFYNTEQAFMWEKAIYFGDMKIAEEIMRTPNPKDNKALGRKVKNFNASEWSKVSFQIMVDVNYAKFTQNRIFKSNLLETGNKILVEASPVDKIWGIGLIWSDDRVLNENNWLGLNLLGKALMVVRDKIKSQMSDDELLMYEDD